MLIQYTTLSVETYTKVVSPTGPSGYKQYRPRTHVAGASPYIGSTIGGAYHERIIQKTPRPAKRKDRI